MFHITFWKSPDPSVIISPLPPPSSPSSSLHLRPSLLLLFHPFILLRPPCIPPCTHTEWFLLSASSAETMFETWYCLSGSIRLSAVRGPSAPHQAPTLHISCQTLTSPTWESSPPLLFVSTFLYLVLSIFYPPSFLLPLSSFHFPRLLNLFGVIIAPLAKCDTTSIFPL